MNQITEQEKQLQATHISKFYNNRPVVRDVSIHLKRGEVVGLLGPNGAGKTTCFSIIAGLIKTDTGLLTIDGNNITNLPMYKRARAGISYLPQESSIFKDLSVEENILAALEGTVNGTDKREQALESLLAEFSITHLRYAPAVALSGGERRRVEIARTLANHPSFILLDEPLAGIDPVAVGDIKELIKKLKDRGIGILITDHNVKDILDIVDRTYIIYDGQILKEGTPKEIVKSQRVKKVYLGEEFDW
jgi:lipopolysaccharide export system ATP-binding protein